MTFYLYDQGDGYTPYESLETATDAGNDLINIYRDQCDPEWPEYVDGISIYESNEADDPSNGRLVARSVMCDIKERPDDVDDMGYSPSLGLDFGLVDFYCDYKMDLADV